jgi:hypothetical protein
VFAEVRTTYIVSACVRADVAVVELSVYVDPEEKDAVKEAATEKGYSNTSEYVRDLLPECTNE